MKRIGLIFVFVLAAVQALAQTVITPSTPAQVFNVTSYGAACNGTTDDTAAIQAAVTAWKTATDASSGSAGMTVLAGPGRGQKCRVTAPINFTGGNASGRTAKVQDLYLYGVFNYTGPIGVVDITNGGNYTAGGGNATYNNVPLTNGSGSGCTAASITVTTNVVTSVVLSTPGCGIGYVNGDVLSAATADLGGAGAGGLQLTIQSLSGGPIIDAMGRRYVLWDNVFVEGDCTSVPNAGWAIGVLANGGVAGEQTFIAPRTIGCFQFAALYSLNSEQNTYVGLDMRNQKTSGTTFSVVLDGVYHWNWSSSFVTITRTLDTAVSFVSNTFLNASMLTNLNTSGVPLWISRIYGLRFYESYAASTGNCAITLYSVGSGAGGDSKDMTFDLHVEAAPVVNVFCLDNKVAGVFDLDHLAYNDFAPQISGKIFDISTTVTSVLAWDLTVSIGSLAGGASLFDTPNVWTVTPVRIEVPSAANYVAPLSMRGGGWICFNANASCAPSGPYNPPLTFATLPTAVAGATAYITDGKAANCGDGTCTTFGTTVTAGTGAIKLLIWYNGTNWTLAGK